MTLSSNFALKRGGGGRNNEGGVTTREYGNNIIHTLSMRRMPDCNLQGIVARYKY